MPKVVGMSTYGFKPTDYTFEIDKHSDELLRLFFGTPKVEKPKRGDKVEVTITGYVDRVDGDTLVVANKRTAFPGEATTAFHGPKTGEGVNVRVLERGPSPIKVGDTITAAQVKATPWKRGTQIKYVGLHSDDDRGRYVLRATGDWCHLQDGQTYPFDAFGETALYVVEHAPGK